MRKSLGLGGHLGDTKSLQTRQLKPTQTIIASRRRLLNRVGSILHHHHLLLPLFLRATDRSHSVLSFSLHVGFIFFGFQISVVSFFTVLVVAVHCIFCSSIDCSVAFFV
ncbi:unnamed protein product [Citrullus colocynthis]|uniref:Transmembrane protein n=1 Tax=Citrullus colocynthis TaxID=252529 RepID=A0ABP0Z834_9ROSI